MDTETTRALVKRLYDAYSQGDVGAFADVIHDDIDWVIYGPVEVFSFAGPRRGKDAVLAALADLGRQFELKRYTPEIIVADGDRAAAFSNVAFEQRTTGRMLAFKLVDFMRFQDGRVIEYREMIDSFDVTQQALGRWLRV